MTNTLSSLEQKQTPVYYFDGENVLPQRHNTSCINVMVTLMNCINVMDTLTTELVRTTDVEGSWEQCDLPYDTDCMSTTSASLH